MGCLLRQGVPDPGLLCATCGGAPRWAIQGLSTRGRGCTSQGPGGPCGWTGLLGTQSDSLQPWEKSPNCPVPQFPSLMGPELRAWLQGRLSRGWLFLFRFPGRETEALSVCGMPEGDPRGGSLQSGVCSPGS